MGSDAPPYGGEPIRGLTRLGGGSQRPLAAIANALLRTFRTDRRQEEADRPRVRVYRRAVMLQEPNGT